MSVYYNEFDPMAADWLRYLMLAGLIPMGDVDERSIIDVQPDDLKGYTQCHFFARIGGWPYALQLAGWGDRPVWTGSCPCQPFSTAGKKKGEKDVRHLWPEFYRLIAECRPAAVFGEQVASKLGRDWLAGLFADLESVGYAVAGADLCAASVGAPHIRQRLWWVADAAASRRRSRIAVARRRIEAVPARETKYGRRGSDGGLADAECGTAERHGHEMARATSSVQGEVGQQRIRDDARNGRTDGGLGNADSNRGATGLPEPTPRHEGDAGEFIDAGSSLGAWDSYIWLPCADGKARRIEPGIAPLAHGVSGRVAQLRGLGNAIVAPLAAKFIQAYLEVAE